MEPTIDLPKRTIYRNFTPARGNLLVRAHKRRERTDGGIIVTTMSGDDTQGDTPTYVGTVMRVGPPQFLMDSSEGKPVAKEGDTIIFTKIMPCLGIKLHLAATDSEQDYIIIDAHDVAGVLVA